MSGFSGYGSPPSVQDTLESVLSYARLRDQMRFEQQQQQPQQPQQAPQTFSQPGFPQHQQPQQPQQAPQTFSQPGFPQHQQPQQQRYQQFDQPGFSQPPQTAISALDQLIAHNRNSNVQREQLLDQFDREFKAEAAQRRQQTQTGIRKFVVPPGGSNLIPPMFQIGGNNTQSLGRVTNPLRIPAPDPHEYEYASLRPDGTPRFR